MVNQLYLLLILPVCFIVYSIYTLKNNDITDELMIFIRRIYYSLCVLLIVLIIISIEPSYDISTNPLGIPSTYWLILLTFIVGILIAIIFDFLIISASGIKEISFGWAKVTKAEIKSNIKEQVNNINYITQLIDAEYEVIQSIEEYLISQKIVEKVSEIFDDFPYEDELVAFIDYFYQHCEKIKRVKYIHINEQYKHDIKKEYKFSQSTIKIIEKSIKLNKSSLIKEKNYNLFFPYKLFSNEMILIIVQSNEVIYEIEQRFILNLLKIFENYLVNYFNDYLISKN